MTAVRTTLATLVLATTVAGATACRPDSPPAEAGGGAQAPVAKPSLVERGEYLVNTSGCHDCHTPWAMTAKGPSPDMTRALSGHPAELVMPPAPTLPPGPWIGSASATNTAHAGPWGVSFSANLTPDKATGLGTWTRQNFVDTIRNGRHLGAGRPLLPPMPWPVYSNMTDDDLGAVFAYLQTIPAIDNRVPEPRPPVVAASPAAPVKTASR